MARTMVYLVRHGEQAPDGGLSALGRDQSRRLGERLRGVPFGAIHHSPLLRAAQTADVVSGVLPEVPTHACELVADRTPMPSAGHEYPAEYGAWLDGVPDAERDEGAVRIQAAVEHFGVTGAADRHELLITHNFVIGWFVRHALDAPAWRWIGLNQANCGLTIVQWQPGRPPSLVCFNDTGHLWRLGGERGLVPVGARGGQFVQGQVQRHGQRGHGEEGRRRRPTGLDLAQRLGREPGGGRDLDHAAFTARPAQ